MVLSASDRNILRGILLFLVVAHPAMAQQADWTWKDRSGRVRTSADLRGILEKHKTWLYSKGISGKRADLSGANLVNANGSGLKVSKVVEELGIRTETEECVSDLHISSTRQYGGATAQTGVDSDIGYR